MTCQIRGGGHEETGREYVRQSRRGDTGAGRARGGPHWQLQAGRLVGLLLGRADDAVDDRENSQLLEGDVGEAVARLKEEDGPELQVHGSSDLIQTLLRHSLIDEFRVWIFPVVLGTGKRLFGEGAPSVALKLVDSQVSSTGVMMATYEPTGEIPKGSFALEEPTEAELSRRARLSEG